MKKILSLLMAFVLLCGVMLSTALPVGAMPAGREMQTIEAMNGLLNGVTWDVLGMGDVDNWSDEQVNHFLCAKMIWDSYGGNPWLPAMGVPTETSGDGYIHVERSIVEKLTQDIFGRTFVPVEIPYMLEISGGEVLFGIAAGEHTQTVVQDFIQRGDYYVAVGCAAWFGGAGSEVEDYFQAVFRKNEESGYGMTLVLLEKISGNQSFAGVTAEASSVLSGGDYKAANVLDSRGSTAWVEGTSGTGIGEFVELMAADGAKLDLCGLEIDPGYHKNEDILTKNGWPSKILVETDDGFAQEFYCYSTDTQTILFNTPVEARCVRVTILEAEAGSKYTDTCISEIRLKGIDTDKYFENLVLDLPEETQPADAPAWTFLTLA